MIAEIKGKVKWKSSKKSIATVKNGKIKEETINQAVKRILAWKYAYKVIE